MEKYAVSPAPIDWKECLKPVYDLVVAALEDTDPTVRAHALQELGRFWKWSPGQELVTTGEIDLVANWKESIYARVFKALGDTDASVRGRAVSALSTLPIDLKASPAVALINDKSFEVRLYVLAGFAERPTLLDEEAVAGLLFDSVPAVASAAENVLKSRGLTPEQIGLCKLAVHPLPHMRASVIPMIEAREDIDPTVWLVFMSRDKDKTVQLKAVEALAQRSEPDARRRLQEIADDPRSAPDVREAAAKNSATTTVALPPLPGSTSLNPKAN
jgi:HEAT repeat protein